MGNQSWIGQGYSIGPVLFELKIDKILSLIWALFVSCVSDAIKTKSTTLQH